MPEKKSPFAPKRDICSYCSGTGWAFKRDIWSDELQRTITQNLPGVVPCLCTKGHGRQAAYQKGVDCNAENQRVNFGNDWREDYQVWADKALEAINPKIEREQEPLPF